MSTKNKQYKIDKGLMLFTQPRSPFFYGKIRLNRKYVTKSFAPITDLDEAKVMLLDWQRELLSQTTIPTSTISSPDKHKSRLNTLNMLQLKMIPNSWKLVDMIPTKKI